jgi:hypothetical protein
MPVFLFVAKLRFFGIGQGTSLTCAHAFAGRLVPITGAARKIIRILMIKTMSYLKTVLNIRVISIFIFSFASMKK